MSRVYIGYDLGDGETIVSYHVSTGKKNENVEQKTFVMPGMDKNDVPIPTAFCKIGTDILLGEVLTEVEMTDDSYFSGNFKKRPTDLLQNYSKQDYEELERIFFEETTVWPDVQLPDSLIKLRDDIVTFTDALFNYKTVDENGKELCFMDTELGPYFGLGDKIDSFTFCVGHPTKWALDQNHGALDVAIYKKIMQQTCLGKGNFEYKGKSYPSELILDAESRAAFLYAREYYGINKNDLNNSSAILLLDVGSSTTDLTAMKLNNEPHHDGNTFLGARIIDYQILNFYQESIKNKNEYKDYDDYVRNNNGEKQVLLLCRLAKERIFSKRLKVKPGISQAPATNIEIPGFSKLWAQFTDEDLKNIEKQPVKTILKTKLEQPDTVLNLVKDNTWEEELTRYLSEQNNILKSKDFNVKKLILTGSASVMPSVSRACNETFGCEIISDPRRACSIASGLVLTGIYNERSKEFKENVEIFFQHLPSVIEEEVLTLAENVSVFMSNYIADDVIEKQILNWKKGELTTLDDAIEVIKHNCNESGLKNLLKYNDQYNSIIKTWIDSIIDKIAKQLSSMGKKYGGVEIGSEDIKGIIFPDVSVSGLPKDNNPVDPFGGGYDILNSLLSIISNVVSTFAVVIVGLIVAAISEAIGAGIFAFLILNPIGIPVLIAIAVFLGIKCGGNVHKILDDNKERIISKINSWNFPIPVRKIIPDVVLIGKIPEQKEQIRKKVYNSFSSAKTKNELAKAIITNFRPNIDRCVREIRYVIENNAIKAEWEQESEEAPMSLRDQIARRLENL